MMVRKKVKRMVKRATRMAASKSTRRKKTGGGSYRRLGGGLPARDLDDVALNLNKVALAEKAQKDAFFSEMMLKEAPSLKVKLLCKIGLHGDGKRQINYHGVDSKGEVYVIRTWVHKYFCVNCGKEWTGEGPHR